MTKPVVAFAALFLLLLAAAAVAPVSAHGSRPAPPLYTRIGNADDDGQFAPGGCNETANQLCGGSEDAKGLDLLSLDARETHLANGTAAVDFLVGYQLGGAGLAQTVQVFLKAG